MIILKTCEAMCRKFLNLCHKVSIMAYGHWEKEQIVAACKNSYL